MDFDLSQPSIFAENTNVGVYAAASVPDRTKAPTGAAIQTKKVENGKVTFTGLSADTSYFGGQEVSAGVWRYVHFIPGTPGVDVVLDADSNEIVSGDWTFTGVTTFEDAIGVEALLTAEAAHVEGALELDGDLNHDGEKVGFYGQAPATQPTALTAISGETIDATYGEQEKKVLENLKKRSEELETKLKALGLLA